jgi:hypothetical protein
VQPQLPLQLLMINGWSPVLVTLNSQVPLAPLVDGAVVMHFFIQGDHGATAANGLGVVLGESAKYEGTEAEGCDELLHVPLFGCFLV